MNEKQARVIENHTLNIQIREVEERPPSLRSMVERSTLTFLGTFSYHANRFLFPAHIYTINFVDRPPQATLVHELDTGKITVNVRNFTLTGTLLDIEELMDVCSRIVHGLIHRNGDARVEEEDV